MQVNLMQCYFCIIAHWGGLNEHSNLLESSCSALIPLCFLMHWPGMWCCFITEAEATSSVSSPGALATHLDTVCNHNWMPESDKLSCLYGKSKSSRGESLESGQKDASTHHWKRLERPGQGNTETSAALKNCHRQWTQMTMNLASSLSFSE